MGQDEGRQGDLWLLCKNNEKKSNTPEKKTQFQLLFRWILPCVKILYIGIVFIQYLEQKIEYHLINLFYISNT